MLVKPGNDENEIVVKIPIKKKSNGKLPHFQ